MPGRWVKCVNQNVHLFWKNRVCLSLNLHLKCREIQRERMIYTGGEMYAIWTQGFFPLCFPCRPGGGGTSALFVRGCVATGLEN